MVDASDPTRWVGMRIAAASAAREVAQQLLQAHGTHIVAISFDPPRPNCAVVIGDQQALRTLLPGVGAMSVATQRHWMRTMTRLGLSTSYNHEQFAAGFDADAQRMLRAIDAILDQRHGRR